MDKLTHQMLHAHNDTKCAYNAYRRRAIICFIALLLFALLVSLKLCAVAPARAGTAAGAEGAPGFSPVDLRAFCVHMIAERGHPGDAREIADAIVDQGLPLLDMPDDEAACLLLAMIDVESDFRIKVKGCAGECGLLQWKPCYYAKYAPDDDWYSPETNIYVGATVLGHRLSSTDDLWLAVQRYNRPAARMPGSYARKVRHDYKIYRLQLKHWEPPEWMERL